MLTYVWCHPKFSLPEAFQLNLSWKITFSFCSGSTWASVAIFKKLPQIHWPETTHLYTLTVSVGKETRHSQTGPSAPVLSRPQSSWWLGCGPSGAQSPVLSSSGCGQTSVHCGCRTEGPWLPTGYWLEAAPGPRGPPQFPAMWLSPHQSSLLI